MQEINRVPFRAIDPSLLQGAMNVHLEVPAAKTYWLNHHSRHLFRIDSIVHSMRGAVGSGSWKIQINGVDVPGLTGTFTATKTTATPVGSATLPVNGNMTLVISGLADNPRDLVMAINYTRLA